MTIKRASPSSGATSASSESPRKKHLCADLSGRPRFSGCVSIKLYEALGKLGEGTFGLLFALPPSISLKKMGFLTKRLNCFV
jgi:hypothetical protein